MTLSSGNSPGILQWRSYYRDHCWFEASISLPNIGINNCTDLRSADFLIKVLTEANKKNPGIFSGKPSYNVTSILEFNPRWGLGSSSSLINNIAAWFGIDAYGLFAEVQQGSAYDIACASAQGPIWYRIIMGNPVSQHVDFNPVFKDNLALVYSGRKQNSAESVSDYLKNIVVGDDDKARISAISRDIVTASGLQDFNGLLDEHENIMSKLLNEEKIKKRFPDFPGSIKSLGAWGGDFFLASSEIGYEEIKSYFSTRGLKIIFSWEEMVMNNE